MKFVHMWRHSERPQQAEKAGRKEDHKRISKAQKVASEHQETLLHYEGSQARVAQRSSEVSILGDIQNPADPFTFSRLCCILPLSGAFHEAALEWNWAVEGTRAE